jgi:transposase
MTGLGCAVDPGARVPRKLVQAGGDRGVAGRCRGNCPVYDGTPAAGTDAEQVAGHLRRYGGTAAVAESVTGGNVATRLAAADGARQVGARIDVKSETLRGWAEQTQVDAGTRPGTTSDDQAELIRLRREVSELKRANDILKTASAFFAAAELDRRRESD